MKRLPTSKRHYTAPHLTHIQLAEAAVLMGVSGNGSIVDADYGGVDYNGTMDPAAKRHDFGTSTFE